jgi:hypothetical protein
VSYNSFVVLQDLAILQHADIAVSERICSTAACAASVRVCSIAACADPVTASLQRSMLFLDKSSPEMSTLQQLSNIILPAIPHTCVLDPDGFIPLVKCHCEHEKIYNLFTFLELWSIIGI